jgi:eukaryotic translation initiation factor 2C
MEEGEDLPPLPPTSNLVPKTESSKPKRIPAAQPGLASRGQRINLVANHYRVNVKSTDDYFYHYSVSENLCIMPYSVALHVCLYS